MAYNYGGRIGVATLILLARRVCDLYTKYAPSIISFINASSLSAEDKAAVLAWLNAAQSVCAALRTSVEVVYEK